MSVDESLGGDDSFDRAEPSGTEFGNIQIENSKIDGNEHETLGRQLQ